MVQISIFAKELIYAYKTFTATTLYKPQGQRAEWVSFYCVGISCASLTHVVEAFPQLDEPTVTHLTLPTTKRFGLQNQSNKVDIYVFVCLRWSLLGTWIKCFDTAFPVQSIYIMIPLDMESVWKKLNSGTSTFPWKKGFPIYFITILSSKAWWDIFGIVD